ncbi:MAG: HAD family hydrolase [Clostridia bacterium]|nr:HAD family hydrolase [Clostridia bacterium]
MIKLIALDMDGTILLSDHRTIHPENIRAIREAQAAGLQVFISTGRLPEDVSDFLHRAGLTCAMVCCNGACAYSGPLPEGTRILEHVFSPELANHIIDIMLPYGIMINAFEHGQVSTVARSETHHYHLMERGLIREMRGEAALRTSAQRGILKFYTMEAPGTASVASPLMDILRTELAQRCPGIQITRSSPGIVEVMPENVGKGLTLIQAAKCFGISPAEIMAVGDEENDLDMLERAGFSVAMGNSSPKVLAACSLITLDNDSAGAAEAIRYALGVENTFCRPNRET